MVTASLRETCLSQYAEAMTASPPAYDITRSYRWNYDHAPEPISADVSALPAHWSFCGLPVETPLGIAAGPLLNGRWVLYYASLGYSVLTYKTVRSVERECYPQPNLLPVDVATLSRPGQVVPACENMQGSWAISFGMPSMSPEVWRADIERTRGRIPSNTVLAVSVVGTEQEGGTLDDLAADYAKCARWAVESGAQVIEANFSCPNVCSTDGQLDRDPKSASIVAAAIHDAIGTTPLLLKIGYVAEEASSHLLAAVAPFVAGLSMTNCISATVRANDGSVCFNGERRGIGGVAIRDASVEQVRRFRRAAGTQSLFIVGVGGVASPDDVSHHLNAGADAVHVATAAMTNPGFAMQFHAGGVRNGRRTLDHAQSVDS